MNKNPITIAIDGHSSCGKSTLAKELAECLNYIYIDSGAMYRAVTYFMIQHNLDYHKESDIDYAINNINIKFDTRENDLVLLLNGEDVSKEIRTAEVSNVVSEISSISKIRKLLVDQQQKIGKNGGIVMDGRDIASVVFPNAEIKFFITADPEVRTTRRYNELIERGNPLSRTEVKSNLLKRDYIDSTRNDSPLIQTKDSILIDNSSLTKSQQLHKAIEHIKEIYPLISINPNC